MIEAKVAGEEVVAQPAKEQGHIINLMDALRASVAKTQEKGAETGKLAKKTFLAPFVTEEGGKVRVGLTNPSELAYGNAQSQSLTITPDFLTRTLDTGTAVVLQASNDITVNSPITVAAGRQRRQSDSASRSIILNARITTDNGALT